MSAALHLTCLKENRIRVAAELTLASLYTVGTKGRPVGGADEGWIQEEWTGTCYFLWGRVRVVPVGVVMAHATQVPNGVSLSAFWRKLGEGGL